MARLQSHDYVRGTGGKKIREGTRASRVANIFAISLFAFSVIIGISLISFTVTFMFNGVDGTSMMRTINASSANTDSVLSNRYSKPKAGDVVIVNHTKSDGTTELHIKRLLAIGPATIHFELANDGIPVNPAPATRIDVYNTNAPFNYNIYVNGVLDSSPAYENNHANRRYNAFYNWQEFNYYDPLWYAEHQERVVEKWPKFRDADSNGISFRRASDDPRWEHEIFIPAGWVFYMGDNRGGNTLSNSDTDFWNMSIDCTTFGPQPKSHIVAVVAEIVRKKTAQQWFIDKVVFYITFGLVKR